MKRSQIVAYDVLYIGHAFLGMLCISGLVSDVTRLTYPRVAEWAELIVIMSLYLFYLTVPLGVAVVVLTGLYVSDRRVAFPGLLLLSWSVMGIEQWSPRLWNLLLSAYLIVALPASAHWFFHRRKRERTNGGT